MKNQTPSIKEKRSQHGGSIKYPQKRKRPLSTSKGIHVVLSSSKAKGDYSLSKHKKEIENIIQKFAHKYHVEICSFSISGNHLHLHIKLFRRRFYSPFIRAISSAIMMKVTGFNRWNKKPEGFQFWDSRPFSSVI